MEITFSPLFSGSSGNCLYVSGGGARILVDAGVSATRITKELSGIGVNISDIDAILVTHEHDDHIKGIGVLMRKYGIPVYTTSGTMEGMLPKIGVVPQELFRFIRPGEDFYINDLNVQCFPTDHDANESVCYTFSSGAALLSVATDIGSVREGWLRYLYGSQAVILESNYDRDMLLTGPYPYKIKHRIDSIHGHLSNDDAGIAAVKLAEHGTQLILLGHLSENNNFPDLALTTCGQYLHENGYAVGKDISLIVTKRNECTGVFHIQADISD